MEKNDKKIILASKSPRRKEILANAGYLFTVEEADTEEKVTDDLSHEEAVIKIALEKARFVKNRRDETDESVIIAADTMVLKSGNLMGKPCDEEEARKMLNMLSDSWHKVLTGYVVLYKKNEFSGCEITDVKFRKISEKEINEYIKTGQPFDKAGAYGVQDRASAFVERIDGDFFNVMGLPICKISLILNNLNACDTITYNKMY